MWVRTSFVWLLTLALGCTSGLKSHDGVAISSSELLAGAPLGDGQDPPGLIDNEDVLAVSPEMRDFLDASIHQRATIGVRMNELIDAIINGRTFGLEFDGKTHTASETFRLRQGNCLSFSNMLVAMARYVQLEASYQEVQIPPDWTLQNDVFLLNRHVNVHVDMGPLDDHVVDFNIDDFKSSYDMRRIPDSRARAHYFNNMGVERMQAGDTASALAYFRKAIADNDRQFSPAWANLGTLYSRNGHRDYAEAAYFLALRVDDSDLVVMSNLVGFYEPETHMRPRTTTRQSAISSTPSARRRTRISSIFCSACATCRRGTSGQPGVGWRGQRRWPPRTPSSSDTRASSKCSYPKWSNPSTRSSHRVSTYVAATRLAVVNKLSTAPPAQRRSEHSSDAHRDTLATRGVRYAG
jgi:tetratricopeptide (TPR) repeat protein